jgi:hypothetical protein
MKRTYSIVAALSICLFIYLFYRSEKTVVNELLILISSRDTYAAIKIMIMRALPLNELIVFSLPGGLWIFCATALSQGFYMKVWNYKLQVGLAPILFAVGLEVFQLVHLTNGTFDLWDVASYLTGWLLAWYAFRSQRSQQNILSPFTLNGFICLSCFFSVYLAHVNQ